MSLNESVNLTGCNHVAPGMSITEERLWTMKQGEDGDQDVFPSLPTESSLASSIKGSFLDIIMLLNVQSIDHTVHNSSQHSTVHGIVIV